MVQQKKWHFFIVDDDILTVELLTRLLQDIGHQVTSATSSYEALKQINQLQPDCVLCDLSMPDLDGIDLFKSIRSNPKIKQPKFIVVTGKVFEFDRRRAFEHGVDGYITKPINSECFVDDVLEILNSTMVVEFYGVRGTLPVPGPKTVRYGGNTNCVTLRISHKYFLIFDAGTGIKELSNTLIRENKLPIAAKIFITHPHYDHINGMPFFVPMYLSGNHFDIYGTNHGDLSIETLLGNQMNSVYFPVTMKEFSSSLHFHTITEEAFKIDDLHVQTILLNHPGRCLGYRIDFQNKSFCYITDNELYLEDSPYYSQFEVDRLISFIKHTDVLVMDATYSDEDYLKKIGWGHSSVSRVVDVADKAKAKILCLFHHDVDQVDDDIDSKLKQAQAMLLKRSSKTKCIAPHEKERITI